MSWFGNMAKKRPAPKGTASTAVTKQAESKGNTKRTKFPLYIHNDMHGPWSPGYAMKFPLCRTQQDRGIKDIRDSALQYKVKIALHFIGVFIAYLHFTLYSLYMFSACNSQNTLHFTGVCIVCFNML